MPYAEDAVEETLPSSARRLLPSWAEEAEYPPTCPADKKNFLRVRPSLKKVRDDAGVCMWDGYASPDWHARPFTDHFPALSLRAAPQL